MLINALRGHLAEFGIIAPAGWHRVPDLLSDALVQDSAPLRRVASPITLRDRTHQLVTRRHADPSHSRPDLVHRSGANQMR